jgi:hypothetical protein
MRCFSLNMVILYRFTWCGAILILAVQLCSLYAQTTLSGNTAARETRGTEAFSILFQRH